MRTHLLCAIALGLAGTATAASAQDTASINVNSSVAPYCAALAAAPGPLALGELAGETGFVVTSFASSPTYSVPGYYCNAPTTVTLSAAPLMQTDVAVVDDESSFTNRIDYRANLVWDNVSGFDDSVDSQSTPISSAQANIGELIVSVSNPDTAGNLRPISGDYTGAVTLTVALNP